MKPIINEVGNKYGKLTVIQIAGRKRTEAYWKCVCECGRYKEVIGSSLRRGNVKSCGCIHGKNDGWKNLRKNEITTEDEKAFIHLRNGETVIIDIEDLELVKEYRWRRGSNRPVESQKRVLLHRLIMNVHTDCSKVVIFRDKNLLNNTKANLKVMTRKEFYKMITSS
jgi:hypothetical protein